MLTIYSERQKLHNPPTEILGGELVPYFEMPERVDMVLNSLRDRSLGTVIAPEAFSLEPIIQVHTPEYVTFLESAWSQWHLAYPEAKQAVPYCFPQRGMRSVVPEQIEGALGYYSMDMTAPVVAGTWEAIRTSANSALTAQKKVMEGEDSAFALCRPPGHHASADVMGGYCYLNNAAIAAQAFLDQGAKKVAILDVDYHHGNGTQSIFYDRSDVLFASIHADPKQDYPHFLGYSDETGEGEGEGFNLNLPLPINVTGWNEYEKALSKSLKHIGEYAPDYLVISLGLDTYEDDPISFFKIHARHYQKLGQQIAEVDCPVLFVFEGGYAVSALGENTVSVLEGFLDAR